VPNAVAQLGSQIPLNFFSREGANSIEQSVDSQLSSGFSEECALGFYGVAGLTFSHDHLPGTIVGAG